MKVTFIVTGRALCRRLGTNNKFEALFFHADRKHQLTVETRKFVGASTVPLVGKYIIPKQTKFSVLMSNTNSLSAPSGDEYNIDRILNINELHRSTVQLQHFRPPTLQTPTTSYLSLERANWYTFALTRYEYQYWRHEITIRPPVKTRVYPDPAVIVDTKVGLEIGADFEVQSTGRIDLKMERGVSSTIPFPWENDVRYEIKIANDCIRTDCEDDFWLYYRVLDGSVIQIEQFRHPAKEKEAACNPAIGGDEYCDFVNYFSSNGANC